MDSCRTAACEHLRLRMEHGSFETLNARFNQGVRMIPVDGNAKLGIGQPIRHIAWTQERSIVIAWKECQFQWTRSGQRKVFTTPP